MSDICELDAVNPFLDLVVFRCVKNIKPDDRSVSVSYDLGFNFHPRTRDWVGLFYSGWKSAHDYLEYRWAPMLPRDLNTVHRRRRSVIFDVSNMNDWKEEQAQFCFLYITRDNHVVGVSNNFQFQTLPGYEDDLFFQELEERVTKNSSFTLIDTELSRKRSLDDSFEFINEEPPPIKRRSTKERILIRTRDPQSLMKLPSQNWQEFLLLDPDQKDVNEASVSKNAVVPYVEKRKPIFDVNQINTQPKIDEVVRSNVPMKLTFEHRLAILPGPSSICIAVDRNALSCGACAMGRSLIHELCRRHEDDVKKIQHLEENARNLREELEDAKLRMKIRCTLSEYEASRQNVHHLEMLFVQNQELEEKLQKMENFVNSLIMENKESKKQNEQLSKEQEQDRDVLKVLKDGFQGIIQINGRKIMVTNDESNDKDEWKMVVPRRIERMRKSISKQSLTIASLTKTVVNQRNRLGEQSNRILDIKKKLQVVSNKSMETDRKLVEVTRRIRMILRDRAKCFTNEWRQFARKMSASAAAPERRGEYRVTPYSKTRPAVISYPWNAALQRKCQTCGLIFSSHVDPRVFEEHIAFHKNYPC